MREQIWIGFVQKKELKELIRLCELHASFEKHEYDSTLKEKKLSKYLFSDNPSLYCLVVKNDRELIGYATYMKQFSSWDADFYIYMDCLFLTKGSRGYGIGEKLIDLIKEEARTMNCASIQWQTPVFNTRAIKFYHRLGAIGKSKERFFLKVE